MIRTDRRTLLTGATAAAALAATSAHAQSRPVARTEHGRVRGLTNAGVHVFKGVRYGADTRPMRFRPPQRPRRWSGVRDAIEYGASCPQRSEQPRTSEDCLFLNVWTPALRDRSARPVLVYFHGGAYSNGSGSSPLYDGSNLCRRGDVVVVTVNHRLNVFGYGYFNLLGAPEAWADSGNAGQLDLILALEWVRDNIAEFGGDPSNVTVFGQSGGGAKIATLMAMPAAAGLFHRGWTMSGQQVTASGPQNATLRARAFMDALGVAHDNVAALAELPAERLVEALSADDPVLPRGGVYFGPTLDMRSLTRHPFYPDAAPQSRHIPMVLGNTHDETRAFLREDRYQTLSWDELPEAIAPQLVVDIEPNYVVARYRELFPDMTPTQVFFAATTAGRSWRGQVIEADERAEANTPTWVYQFDWQSPVDDGRWGAPHGIDIPMVFDNTATPGAITGNGEDARVLAAAMASSLIAFARTGDPNNNAVPAWPRYELETRATMMFDTPTRIENDPRGDERRLFDAVPYVQPGT